MVPSQFSDGPLGQRVYVLFPGALGDFLCFAESLPALRRRTKSTVTVVARPAWTSLLDARAVRSASIDSAAVAELFGPAPLERARALLADAAEIYSFTGDGDPGFVRQLQPLAPRVEVFPFRAFGAAEHASDYYARCLEVAPSPVEILIPEEARAWARAVTSTLQSPLLALHAGSGARRKNWDGFAAVAQDWRLRGGAVLELRGPAEEGTSPLDHTDGVVREDLPRVAALVETACVFIGNDSGITHLAAAVGSRGLALFGPAESIHWRPRSAGLRVMQAAETCPSCTTLCTHQLPVAAVIAKLREIAEAPERA